MSFLVDWTVVKCSKCGSQWNETVVQRGQEFIRCLSCGHEGGHRMLMPQYGENKAWTAVREKLNERTF